MTDPNAGRQAPCRSVTPTDQQHEHAGLSNDACAFGGRDMHGVRLSLDLSHFL